MLQITVTETRTEPRWGLEGRLTPGLEGTYYHSEEGQRAWSPVSSARRQARL
jgi:hypothetical protein